MVGHVYTRAITQYMSDLDSGIVDKSELCPLISFVDAILSSNHAMLPCKNAGSP